MSHASSPTPQYIREHGNALRDEGSLYLRQHAHNPINWHPWNEHALQRAKLENKPIFLSIGYSSCHWCHVMEHEVFDKDDVAAFMNEHFICIKVDREERPDLDTIYMEAVQLLTGGGGWPMSVFLTPELKPFYGGTYFPYPTFKQLTSSVLEVFRDRRGEVEQQAQQLASVIAQAPAAHSRAAIDHGTIEDAVRQAQQLFDNRWGGIRSRMKFPTPLRWAFLLHYHRKTGDERCSRMVRTTLDHMASGGLHDHLGGGFHRYTVDEIWLVPHFEKMLYDNAQLASLYLQAASAFGSKHYERVACDTLDFMLREMTSAEGGVYASFDADSPEGEGHYYAWTPEELRSIAGQADGDALSMLLGVSAEGNFEGKNVLTRRVPVSQVAIKTALSEDYVEHLLDRWRDALLRARSTRPAPGLDRKIVTAWNGLAMSALSQGFIVTGEQRYLIAAERCADFLWRVHRRDDGTLWRASNDGVAQSEAILDDYGALACGLLDLAHASGAPRWAAMAAELAQLVDQQFVAPQGVYYLTRQGAEAPLGRKLDVLDNVEPSGNSAMLQAFVRLAAFDDQYSVRAERMLDSQSSAIAGTGLEMAWWLDGALFNTGPFYAAVVAGEVDDPRTLSLLRTVREKNPPHVMLARVGPTGLDPTRVDTFPSLAGKTAVGGTPMAYVCTRGSCMRPTMDPDELRSQLMQGWEV